MDGLYPVTKGEQKMKKKEEEEEENTVSLAILNYIEKYHIGNSIFSQTQHKNEGL